jgi:hypothetical protein
VKRKALKSFAFHGGFAQHGKVIDIPKGVLADWLRHGYIEPTEGDLDKYPDLKAKYPDLKAHKEARAAAEQAANKDNPELETK